MQIWALAQVNTFGGYQRDEYRIEITKSSENKFTVEFWSSAGWRSYGAVVLSARSARRLHTMLGKALKVRANEEWEEPSPLIREK